MALGGPAAKLEQLRLEGRSRGREWLGSLIQDIKRDEVRELARAAGLRARTEDKAWVPVGELRKAVLEHLAPERNTVPSELARHLLSLFFFGGLFYNVTQLVNMMCFVIIVFIMFSMFFVFMLFCGLYSVYCHFIFGIRMGSSVESSGRMMALQRLQRLLRAHLLPSKRNCPRTLGVVLLRCMCVMY